MDEVIRITSNQGFSASWVAKTGVAATPVTTPKTLNLCDFVIPRGLNVDLTKSYIAFNGQINSDDGNAKTNAQFDLATGAVASPLVSNQINVPVAALVRNCNLQNNRGMVESVRRVDTLNCGLFGLLENAEGRKNNLNTFANYQGGRGVGNRTSYLLNPVTNNTSNDGSTTNAQHTSVELARDLKIPLAEIFGVGNSTSYSTDVFGETRIHLETNFQNLSARVLGGNEATDLGFDETSSWGSMVAQNAIADGADATALETTLPYDDFQYTMPFFVGQHVVANATQSAGTAFGTDVDCEISAIQFQTDNTTTPPTGLTKCFITLARTDGTPFYTNDAGGGNPSNLTGITLKAYTGQALTCVINRAELVLQVTEAPSDKSITFDTWTTEEDQGNGQTNFHRAYHLEGDCTMWMVGLCESNQILPAKDITSYRFAINNEEETGNRDIVMAQAATQGSALQYDRLIRALDHQSGMGFRNSQLKFYHADGTQAAAYNKAVSMIAETAPATADSKILNLNIVSGGLEDIRIFKSVQRTI